jgi:PAS domain S-box-containing protein
MSAINQDEQYVYQGYGVGAVDYLLKPFDPYILKSKVAIFADLYRKNKVIQEQSQRLHEAEVRNYAQALDKLEITSLRRYQYLADSLPQIVFRLLPEGTYEYFNKVWFEYTGFSVTSSSEFGWKEAIHPQDLTCILNILSHQDEISHDCEVRIRNNQGEYRWHLVKMEPELYEDPTEIKSWLGTAIDIEDRKRTEMRQRFLAEAGALLVSSLDYEKTLEEIAKLAIPQLGDWCAFDVVLDGDKLETLVINHNEKEKLPLARKLHESYLLSNNSKVGAGNVLRTGIPEMYNEIDAETLSKFALNKEQIELTRKLGDNSVIIAPMAAQGKTVGTITFSSSEKNHYTANDIQLVEELGRRAALAYENSRLYKLSQKAIEIRNDFLSIASHELNTPITSLKLQLQLTKKSLEIMGRDGGLPVEKFTRSIDASVRQVDRLINLVQVLLDVSRIQAGKLSFQFEMFDLPELIHEVTERFKEVLSSSACTLEVTGNIANPVFLDRTRIEQVVINLLTNAVKYAPGKLELNLKDTGKGIELDFQDHGKGIPENKLKSIFDRFERASSNETISGLGLGLFIVKQIVDGHGGEVKVQSEIDKGTLFKVLLPYDARDKKGMEDRSLVQ